MAQTQLPVAWEERKKKEIEDAVLFIGFYTFYASHKDAQV